MQYVLFAFLTISFSSGAQEPVNESEQVVPSFQQCVIGLQARAIAAGVPKKLADDVLGNARFLEKIITYDRNQPEFVQTFSGYFAKRVTDWRINKGRELLAKHAEFLTTITKKYGVPAPYLMAFWGLETNFGSYKGKMPIIDSLTTLSCDQRRSAYFSGELIRLCY